MAKKNNNKVTMINKKANEVIKSREATLIIDPDQELTVGIENTEAEELATGFVEEVPDFVEAMAHKKAMNRNNQNLTIRKVKTKSDAGELNFDLAIQRGEVWNSFQMSLFINSLIVNFPIPQVFAWDKDRNDVLHILDGKQRLTTIINFLNDGFRLDKKTPAVFSCEIAGKLFSELHPNLQDEILSYSIDFQICRDQDPNIITDIFIRLNNGTQLTKFEKIRAEIGTEVMEFVDQVAKMKFWSELAAWTARERTHFVSHQVILATMMILNDETELSIDNIGSYAKWLRDTGIHSDIHVNTIEKLIAITNYLGNIPLAEKDRKKIYRTTHIPMLFTVLNPVVDPARTADNIIDWFKNRGQAYKNACAAGVAQSTNVKIRLEQIKEYFSFFNYPSTPWEVTYEEITIDEVADTVVPEVTQEIKTEAIKTEEILGTDMFQQTEQNTEGTAVIDPDAEVEFE